jgi:hypothetical protein
MSKDSGVTRQGVKNLDEVGPRPKKVSKPKFELPCTKCRWTKDHHGYVFCEVCQEPGPSAY